MLGGSDNTEAIPVLIQQLFPGKEGGRLTSSKADIITKIWTQVLLNDSKKDELLKLAVLPKFLSLVEAQAADPETAYAAVGCLGSLATYPKALEELTATGNLVNRVISACSGLLQGSHDRSRLPAAQLLLTVSSQPALVPKLEPVLPTLLQLLAEEGGPGWAGGRQVSTAAAGILQALLEPSEYEAESVKQSRRTICLSSGVASCLLGQLCGANEKLLLSAAACLRFMALAPGAADVLAGDPQVATKLLQLLSRGGSGVCAFISGIVWELAAAPTAAQQLLEAGAVPSLLAVLQETAGAAGTKKKSKQKAKKDSSGSGSSPKKGGKGDISSSPSKKGKDTKGRPGSASAGKGAVGPPGAQPAAVLMSDPEAAAEVALCNATGALHHLTFLDAAKQQLGSNPSGLKLLVTLLDKADGQTYDNIVGCLWNVGLLEGNQEKLAAAGAPAHLVRPIPNRWTCAPEGSSVVRTGGAGQGLAGGLGQLTLNDL